MPIVHLVTNIADDKIPTNFNQDMTDFVAKHLKKPKAVVWAIPEVNPRLSMGGTFDPTAMVSVECIGRLKPGVNLAMGKDIEDWITKNLGIPKDRMVVRFFPQRALYCYLGGSLCDVKMDTDEDEDNK